MNEAPRSQAALPFSRSCTEQSGSEQSGQCHRQRRNHTRRHDCGHDPKRCRIGYVQPGGRKRVGGLVDRPAEIEAHHQTEDDLRITTEPRSAR